MSCGTILYVIVCTISVYVQGYIQGFVIKEGVGVCEQWLDYCKLENDDNILSW
jgi:hypothetical protein